MSGNQLHFSRSLTCTMLKYFNNRVRIVTLIYVFVFLFSYRYIIDICYIFEPCPFRMNPSTDFHIFPSLCSSQRLLNVYYPTVSRSAIHPCKLLSYVRFLSLSLWFLLCSVSFKFHKPSFLMIIRDIYRRSMCPRHFGCLFLTVNRSIFLFTFFLKRHLFLHLRFPGIFIILR